MLKGTSAVALRYRVSYCSACSAGEQGTMKTRRAAFEGTGGDPVIPVEYLIGQFVLQPQEIVDLVGSVGGRSQPQLAGIGVWDIALLKRHERARSQTQQLAAQGIRKLAG